jgi:hypothetical protein
MIEAYRGVRCHVDHVTKVHFLKFDLIKPNFPPPSESATKGSLRHHLRSDLGSSLLVAWSFSTAVASGFACRLPTR